MKLETLLFSIGLHLEISIDMYDLDDENLIACMILTRRPYC